MTPELSEETVEAMCRAHDAEYGRQYGLPPSRWASIDATKGPLSPGDAEWRAHRLAAMRSAIAASGLVEALAPVVALLDALDGHHGFTDAEPVSTTHMGDGKYNDFPGLTWGDLRKVRALISPPTKEGERP